MPASESLYGLSAEAKWVWVCLLCHASKKKSATFEINVSWFASITGVEEAAIRETLKKLHTSEIIQLVTTTVSEVSVTCQSPVSEVSLEENRSDQIRLDKRREDQRRKELKGADSRSESDAPRFEKLVPKSPPRESNPVSAFIVAYSDAYTRRYGHRPPCLDDGKTIGQIRNFLKNRSLTQSTDLIQIYLQMDDSWFVKKFHDFTTFTQNINHVGLALAKGRDPAKKKSTLEVLQEGVTSESKALCNAN